MPNEHNIRRTGISQWSESSECPPRQSCVAFVRGLGIGSSLGSVLFAIYLFFFQDSLLLRSPCWLGTFNLSGSLGSGLDYRYVKPTLSFQVQLKHPAQRVSPLGFQQGSVAVDWSLIRGTCCLKKLLWRGLMDRVAGVEALKLSRHVTPCLLCLFWGKISCNQEWPWTFGCSVSSARVTGLC